MTSRKPTKRVTRRVIDVEAERFAAGWRLIPDILVAAGAPNPPKQPTVVVDVVRPSDLVAFTVEGYDVELVSGANPELRPKAGAKARLLVRLAFQHLAERAIYEAAALVPKESDPASPPVLQPAGDNENTRPIPPIQALPARGSRIVLDFPAGETVPFTVAGILDAIRRLPMVVHPLALPRQATVTIPSVGPFYQLPGGLVASLGEQGLVVSKAPAKLELHDPKTATGLAALARDQRQLRGILTATAGTAVRTAAPDDPASTHVVSIGDVRHDFVSIVGTDGLVRPDQIFRVRTAAKMSRPPEQLETAIEAPFRLVISPSHLGGWSHAIEPVGADGAPHRVELWHSRLGVRVETSEGVSVDERAATQRIVRAVWTRDRERYPEWDSSSFEAPHDDLPFRTSLDGADRHMLVRQSSETWLGRRGTTIPPRPVAAEGLWLSSLGAWLDLHGSWDTKPYSGATPGMQSILHWDHIAPMGRDQYVRVVYPGYLYPFGHSATLVKVTERKMKDAAPSVAGLYQRMFIVVGEPSRDYDARNLPFNRVRIAPLVTPTIDPPGNAQNSFFWPRVGGADFRWILHTVDKEGRPVRLVTPLLWVAEHYQQFATVDTTYANHANRKVDAMGQDVAYAPVARGGDTVTPTTELRFLGAAQQGTSVPRLGDADVTLPAVQNLSPVGTVKISYNQTYLTHGMGGSANVGEVWADVTGAPPLSFGGSPTAGSDKAGGFMQPDLPIRALSRVKGTVGDAAKTATGDFDPAAFLSGALPKLFGLVPLVDLLAAVGVDLSDAPSVVSEALDRIEGFLSDLERAKQAALDAVDEADRLVERAQGKANELVAQAQAAKQAANDLASLVENAVDDVIAVISSLGAATQSAVESALASPLHALGTAVAKMRQVAPQMPPLLRKQLDKLADVLDAALTAADLLDDIFRFLHGLATSGVQGSFRFDWTPRIGSWPSAANPVLEVRPDSLVLAVEGRAAGKGPMGVEVLAELRDFTLHLLPGEPLVRFKFDHLSFKAGSSGKAEVDVVLNEIEFVGFLSFVEVLKDLIPFDGFSDPPFLDVSPEGLSAGFTLALPNVAVGVFNLSNISLGADLRVPFLGDVVTVGFNFCTRERPFTLAVLFIGGGGWFLMRLSPNGLEVLELGLEAGATLSVDFGVASGSISAMIGVYLRLEGDGGSLTGYFRLRGEVDVLGLISASIELYLSLEYDFPTGKMIGEASLTIKVEVFIFSGSVTIRCQRRFAGSNGDPNFLEVMGMEPDGSSPAWSDYCLAFAGA